MERRIGTLLITILLVVLVAERVSAFAAGDREIRVLPAVVLPVGAVRVGDVATVQMDSGELAERVESLVVGQLGSKGTALAVRTFDISRALNEAGLVPASFRIYGASRCAVSTDAEYAGSFRDDGDDAAVVGESGWVQSGGDGLMVGNGRAEEDGSVCGDELIVRGGLTVADMLLETVAQMNGLDVAGMKVEWSCSNLALLDVAVDRKQIEIEPRCVSGLGSVSFVVLVSEDALAEQQRRGLRKSRDGRFEIRVTGRAYYLAKVLVAKKTLRVGEVVGDHDVHIQLRRMTSRSGREVSNLSAVIGREAACNIRANEVIDHDMIRKLTLVRRKKPVEVSLHVGLVQVRFRGVSLMDGGLNDMVTVRNERTGRTVQGRVTAAGKVVVGDGLDRKSPEVLEVSAATRADVLKWVN